MAEIVDLETFVAKSTSFRYRGFAFRGLSNVAFNQVPSILFDENLNFDSEAENYKAIFDFAKRKGIDGLSALQLARHYRFICRLTDYTLNPLIALFFACSDKNNLKEDAKIICFDLIRYNNEHPFVTNKGCTILNNDIVEILLDNLEYDVIAGSIDREGEDLGCYSFKEPVVVLPIIEDRRISSQSGLFLLWADLTRQEQTLSLLNGYSTEIIIPAICKDRIIKQLIEIGYKEETIYSESIFVDDENISFDKKISYLNSKYFIS